MIGENYNIRTVIPHLGFNYWGFVMRADDYNKSLEGSAEWFDKELKKINECRNVFFDASMVIDKRGVEAAISRFGETKVMYGTDYPFGFSPKIIENRPDNDTLARDLRALMSKRLKNPWRYYYNIYLQVLAFINAEKDLKLDIKEKVMQKNSKRIYKLD
jgi:predicted TIM-barrel fold metal-dependent hydrolase